MKLPPHSEQLKDRRWQQKRLEVFQRAGFRCEDCPDPTSQLNVHHVYYLYGHYIWDHPDFLLKCVCDRCHRRRGEVEQAIFCAVARVLNGLTPDEMREQPIYTFFDNLWPVGQPAFEEGSGE